MENHSTLLYIVLLDEQCMNNSPVLVFELAQHNLNNFTVEL